MVNVNTILAVTALTVGVSAYSIPSNLQNLYNSHKVTDDCLNEKHTNGCQPGKCSKKLQGGFVPGVGSSDATFAYCGDINGAIYIHSQANGGQYADMDIDCDGANNATGDCKNDPSGQGQTAFQDQVRKYGISDLDANIHSYIVFGNEGFDPQNYGMKQLSIMAVVCNSQLHYGVWGDTNGANTVGEASISLAQLCFPNEGLNGDNGHGAKHVMYIGFTGSGSVPDDAKWTTKSRTTFEASLKARGDKLVAALS